MKKPCLCKIGDPCDFHAASCVTCYPNCKGHPYKYEEAVKISKELGINHG